MNDPKSISVSSKHLQLIRLMTEIVEDAAMREMIFAKPDDGSRECYGSPDSNRRLFAASSARAARTLGLADLPVFNTVCQTG